MSGDAYISGRISISPPVTWGELYDKPWATGTEPGQYPDVKVELATTRETTPTGEVLHHSGVAITPTRHETSGYHLNDEVTRIVAAFATAPDGTARRFDGFLHVVWGGGQEMWRVVVQGASAVEVRPVMVWPVGARDEDAAVTS